MIRLKSLLREANYTLKEEESEAAQQAHKLGLKAKGWGLWMDPKTGETVAKTVKGKLVKIDNTEYQDPVTHVDIDELNPDEFKDFDLRANADDLGHMSADQLNLFYKKGGYKGARDLGQKYPGVFGQDEPPKQHDPIDTPQETPSRMQKLMKRFGLGKKSN